MKNDLAEKIKQQDIRAVADHYLTHSSKSGYNCLACGNGAKESGTGAEIYHNAHHNRDELKCFACGKNWNTLELIADCEHLNLDDKNDFVAALKFACGFFGLDFGKNSTLKSKKTSEDKSVNAPTITDNQKQLAFIHADIADAQNNLSAFLNTTGGKFRGLTDETLKTFQCGYLQKWISPKIRLEVEQGKREKLPPPSRRFIIPTPNHYNAVLPELDRTPENKKFWKMHAGTKEIFGAEFLPVDAYLIVVTEGEFDAMSIWQATQGRIAVIAVGGAAEYKKAVSFLQNKFSVHKPQIFILFDPDETGRLNAVKLRDELLKIGFRAVCRFLSDENSKLDANDILQEQGDDKLAQIIDNLVDDAQDDFELTAKAILTNDFSILASHADETASNEIFSADTHSLQDELQEVNRKIAAFEQEKSAAIEKLKSAVSFDKDFVFSDDILNAAAFAKLFDGNTYTSFRIAIQNQNKKEKFIREWQGEVRERMTDIKSRQSDLLAQKKSIAAQIVSAKFVATHDELKDFVIPDGYEISENGIEKIVGDKSLTVSRVPAFIQAKRKNVEDKTHKLVLAYLSENGTWQSIPATGEEIIFNARKLIDLRAYGLPVTSVNAHLLVDYLDDFETANKEILPLFLNTSRCGWYKFGDKDYFVDPRRKNFISDADRDIELVVDDNSTFAQSLKSVGSLDEWRKAYEIAKKSPIARLIVAASVAPPLLNIFDGERNYVLYLYGNTRGGKSTCLLCGASAVGSTDMVISFDGTNNGLLARAAETNDYPFFVDEKQSADKKLQEQFQRFIYSVANGKERQRANKDGTLKIVREWQNITICNGETELLDDNATGGAFSRLLQIHAPKILLPADECKEIRRIIRHSYGHAFPLVIEEIFKAGFDDLRENYNYLIENFAETFPNLLDDYRRYMAIMTLADTLLNIALGVDEEKAMSDALDNAKIIFDFVPTLEEIADTPRERNFVLDFIAQNQKYFLGATSAEIEQLPYVYGKFDDDFVYISVAALQTACKNAGFNYQKLVADLIEDAFFIPDDKILKGRKKPIQSVLKKINGINTRCFKILTVKVAGSDE